MHLKNKTQPKLLYTVLPKFNLPKQERKKQFNIFVTNDLPKLTLYTNIIQLKKKKRKIQVF